MVIRKRSCFRARGAVIDAVRYIFLKKSVCSFFVFYQRSKSSLMRHTK